MEFPGEIPRREDGEGVTKAGNARDTDQVTSPFERQLNGPLRKH